MIFVVKPCAQSARSRRHIGLPVGSSITKTTTIKG